MKTYLNLLLEPELIQSIKIKALEQNKTISQFITDIVKHYLNRA